MRGEPMSRSWISNVRCIDGRLWRHDPMPDDPYLETEIGECDECQGRGKGLSCDGEPEAISIEPEGER